MTRFRDDPDWIPYVARRGWVVITNDRYIRTRPTEAPKAIEHCLRCVHLKPTSKDPSIWDFVVLLRHWDDVVALAGRAGPVWLQLDAQRAKPYERQYRPGEPPRLPSDDRAGRARAARRPPWPPQSVQAQRPTSDPDQDLLPF